MSHDIFCVRGLSTQVPEILDVIINKRGTITVETKAMRLILLALTTLSLAHTSKAHAFGAPVLRGSPEVRFLSVL